MAENKKTYTAVIDVDAKKADKDLDVLTATISTSLGEFENLTQAIGETEDALGKLDPDSKQFKELSGEIQVLRDRFRDTEIQSRRFTEALAEQPGVIGFIGQSFEGLRGTLRVFAANPIIAVLAGITGAVLALRESLSRTEEGQEKLNKITSGFTKILNGLFAIIEPVANVIADLFITLMENEGVLKTVSVVFGTISGILTGLLGTIKELGVLIVKNIITNFKALIGIGRQAGKILKGVFTFDLDLIKEGVNGAKDVITDTFNEAVDNVKGAAKGIAGSVKEGFDSAVDSFKEGSNRLTEFEKEQQAKRLEEQKKFQEEQEKLAEEQRQRELEAEKILAEAQLSLLTERQQELTTAEQAYQDKIKTLKEAGVEDFTAVEEQYKKQVLEINDKYDKEIISQQQAAIKERQELFNSNLDAIKTDLELGTNQFETEYNNRIALVNEKEKLLLSVEGLTESQRTKIREEAGEERLRLEAERLDKRNKFIDEREKTLLNQVNETEQLLLENENLTQQERNSIVENAAQQREQIIANSQQKRQELIEADRERQLENLEVELEGLVMQYDMKRELINQKEQLLLQDETLTQSERTRIQREASNQRRAIALEELDAKREIQSAVLDIASQAGTLLGELAGENETLAIASVIISKAAALGEIASNTATAVAKSIATFPLTGGQPFAGIAIASGVLGAASTITSAIKSINEIKSARQKAKGGSTGGGTSARQSIPNPTAPSIQSTPVPEVSVGEGIDQGSQIGETISAATTQNQRNEERAPLRAYVISENISSQQALDRRINNSATL